MAWRLSGRGMEMCSCKSFCPCWLGPAGEPDHDLRSWQAADGVLFAFDWSG